MHRARMRPLLRSPLECAAPGTQGLRRADERVRPMSVLTASERETLERRLRTRRQALRAEVQAQLANSDDPRIVGLKNELAATEDWVLADILGDLDIAMVTRDLQEL